MAILIPPQPDTVPRPRRRTLILVLAIQQAMIIIAGVGWTISAMDSSGHAARQPIAAVQPSGQYKPGRPPSTKTKDARPCVRSLAWSYTYPTPYLGEVYVDMSANPTATVPVEVTLTWGPWRWRHPVPVRPGLVQFGQGGTLLYYGKLYTTGRTGINPPILLNASEPVCAVFGTAPDGMPKSSLAVNANPGWVHW